MTTRKLVIATSTLLLLTACATTPVGPRVADMPAPGKPFEVFIAEDRECRYWAENSLGISAREASDTALVSSAAAGTVIGATVGALAGGHRGAGGGAAAGMLMGSAVGAGQSANTAHDLQYRYDLAYQQCMYAKGNQLPGYRMQRLPATGATPTPALPPPSYPPPPPPPPTSLK